MRRTTPCAGMSEADEFLPGAAYAVAHGGKTSLTETRHSKHGIPAMQSAAQDVPTKGAHRSRLPFRCERARRNVWVIS
jgi:hypothetical protein